jgi:hypothetical protein
VQNIEQQELAALRAAEKSVEAINLIGIHALLHRLLNMSL